MMDAERWIPREDGGLRTVHAIPRAWDWHFGHLKPYWVLLTLGAADAPSAAKPEVFMGRESRRSVPLLRQKQCGA
jgi:hypothetical protein